MKLIVITVGLFLIFRIGHAQPISISGKTIDAETADPLSYTSIQLEGTGIGTISFVSGEFNLKLSEKYAGKILVFSFMGYKTIKIPVIELVKKDNVIKLKKEEFYIDEIVVMPDSTLLSLLAKAYKKIPDNYPGTPSLLKGFYRETARNSENQYLYFSEAVIETYKSPYKYNADNGQVKIIKSMTNEFPALASFRYRFQQGIFMANEGDFVKKREDFINPKHFGDYNYSLSGTTKYQGKEVYIVNINTKDDSLNGGQKGKIYIEKSTLAYVACEIVATERGISNFNKFRTGLPNLIKYEYSTEYVSFKGKWHIKHVAERAGFTKDNENTSVDGEYISTEISTDLIKPMPLKERINYNDFFSEKAKEFYSEDYWSEYNVLEKDSLLSNQIKLLYSPVQSKNLLTERTNFKRNKSLFKVISKFDLRYGVSILAAKGNEGNYSISYQSSGNSLNLSEKMKSFNYEPTINVQLNFHQNNEVAFNFDVSRSFKKDIGIKSYGFGASYSILLNKWTKPLILDLSLGYSFTQLSRNFSNYRNSTSFSMGNKTIDAESLSFGIGFNTNGILPQIGLKYQLKNKFWLFVSTGYYLPVFTSQKLYISEKSGFFMTRKNSSINLSDNSLQLKYDGAPTIKSHVDFGNYNAKIGIIINF